MAQKKSHRKHNSFPSFFSIFQQIGGLSMSKVYQMSKYFCSEAQNSLRVAARGRGLHSSGPRGLRHGEIPLANSFQPRSSKRRLPGGVAVPPRETKKTTWNNMKRPEVFLAFNMFMILLSFERECKMKSRGLQDLEHIVRVYVYVYVYSIYIDTLCVCFCKEVVSVKCLLSMFRNRTLARLLEARHICESTCRHIRCFYFGRYSFRLSPRLFGASLCLEFIRWKGCTSHQEELHEGSQMGCHLWRILHSIAARTLQILWILHFNECETRTLTLFLMRF